MSASHVTAQKKAAAQTAVAAKPAAAKPSSLGSAPGAGIDDGALRTPSWTAIVEAYHREGNGDREMLLALLHAKAKEDERLAALDLLRAEQLRAYTTHIAVHGPLLYAGAGSPTASTANGGAHLPMNGGVGIPPLGAQNAFAHPNYHPHPHHHQHAHHHGPARAHAASTSAGSTASTSSTFSSSSSSSAPASRGRKKNAGNNNHSQSQDQRDNASRSPSLSHTAESRLSSPESIARTPVDERRLSDFALAASAISEQEKKHNNNSKDSSAHLVVPSLNAAGKRKAGSMEVDTIEADAVIGSSESMTINARPSKRASPSARSALPSISTSLPTPTEEEQQQLHRRTSSSSSSSSEISKLAHAQRSNSPRSLQQILNSELRPLSMSNFKVATSDLRGSASDEDDELADE